MSLDKALEVNEVSARVGDNLEVKCDVTGTPTPPIVWRRNGLDLAALNSEVNNLLQYTVLSVSTLIIYINVE